MSDLKKTENYLKNLNINLTLQQDQNIYDNLQKILKQSKNQPSPKSLPNIWRITMKSKITKFTAAALIIIAVIIGITQLGTPFDPNQAYAGVVDIMQRARTFSCTHVREGILPNGQKNTYENVSSFMEPDLERYESRTYLGEQLIKENITITDYANYQKLILDGVKKQAELQENFAPYTVDAATGELEFQEVQNSFIFYIRNRVIWLGESAAVEDLGIVDLDGRAVRKLQAIRDDQNTTVWLDLKTNLPHQIELQGANSNHRQIYQSIQIDVKLKDELFSLTAPEDYTLKVTKQNWTFEKMGFEKMEIAAKMIFLKRQCFMYANEFRGNWPDQLEDLVTTKNIASEEVLKKVLAPAGNPQGDPVIKYRTKRPGDSQQRVVLYELFELWPEKGAIVCFNLGEPKLITDQKQFEQLIK